MHSTGATCLEQRPCAAEDLEPVPSPAEASRAESPILRTGRHEVAQNDHLAEQLAIPLVCCRGNTGSETPPAIMLKGPAPAAAPLEHWRQRPYS